MGLKDISSDILKELIQSDSSIEVELGDTSKKVREFNHSSVLAFIKDHNLQSGDVRVPTFLIFYYYRVLYQKYSRGYKVGKTEFFRVFKQHFKQVRTGRGRFYMLNESLDMSVEMMTRAKTYDKSRQKRRTNEQK